MQRRWLVAALVVAVLGVAAPVTWYLASPLFLLVELHEPEPDIAAAGPSPSATASLPATRATPPPATAAPTGRPATATTPPPPPPLLALAGRFHGADDFHFGRGRARLLEIEAGRHVVRFDDFAVRNGPDLYVYLSPDPDGYATGAIELGRLRATDGSFNMRVPEGVDVSRARSVVVWCKQFAVLFAVARLEP